MARLPRSTALTSLTGCAGPSMTLRGAMNWRVGSDPRVVVTTTPRPTPLLRAILQDPRVVVTRGSTYDNRANLAAAFLDQIITKYAGTHLGRQEIDAEILDDLPGALWNRSLIEA